MNNILLTTKTNKFPPLSAKLFGNPLTAPQLFYLFLILHIAVWTISPVLIRYTVSADVIESFVWAQHLDWGYDKNPYLIGWITRLGLWISSDNALGYYLIQQLMIGLGFWSIWKLGNLLFNPQKALIAILIYEGCLYFSVYAQTNNDNFPLIGLWGLAAYTFYLACKRQYLRDWLITAMALGLAMMAKYSTVIFMAGLFLYLLTEKNARRSFWQPKLYVAILVFLLLILPNIIWLLHHDLIALRYISFRKDVVENSHAYMKNLDYLGNFIQQTVSNFLGCIVLFALTLPKFTHQQQREKTTTHYLWCIGIFPIMLILISAIILEWKLYWEWGVPFSIFWGLMLVHYLQPNIHHTAILRFFMGVLLAMVISLSGNILISCYLKAGSGSADYPAQQIANYVSTVWQERYPHRLAFVAGSRYTAGYVGFYAKDKPKVFVEWNELFSPGVQEAAVRKYGAIFVQDGHYGTPVLDLPEDYKKTTKQFPASIMQKYPQLIVLPLKTFNYYRNGNTAETVNLLVGILPPQDELVSLLRKTYTFLQK